MPSDIVQSTSEIRADTSSIFSGADVPLSSGATLPDATSFVTAPVAYMPADPNPFESRSTASTGVITG